MDVFSSIFVIVPAFIGLCFFGVFGFIIYAIVKGVFQWNENNAQPVQSAEATLVAKRTSTSGGAGDSSVSTFYHATFETPDGERREFGIGGQEFGLLVEGDQGTLQYQGTRYKGLERHRQYPGNGAATEER